MVEAKNGFKFEAKNGFKFEAVFGVKIWFFCHFFRWAGASSEQDAFFARLLWDLPRKSVSIQLAPPKLQHGNLSVASTWRGNAQGCLALGGYFNTSAKLHRFFEAKSGSIRTSTFPQSKSAHPTQTWPAPFERNPCYNANNGTRDTPGHDYLSSSNAILLHLLL